LRIQQLVYKIRKVGDKVIPLSREKCKLIDKQRV